MTGVCYSVGYGLRIILSASSIRFSHCHTELLWTASLCNSLLRAYSGASDLFSIMLDQCVMSSSQVPLFCECPAHAVVPMHNTSASKSAFIVWLFIGSSHHFTQVCAERLTVVPIHKCYYDTYGQTGDVEHEHKGPIKQRPHMLVCIFLLCKFFDSEIHPYQATFDLCNVLAQAPITPTGQESKYGADSK